MLFVQKIGSRGSSPWSSFPRCCMREQLMVASSPNPSCGQKPSCSRSSQQFRLLVPLTHSPSDCREGRRYCACVERGAGSGDFESGEQEFLSEFDKYKFFTKNRNLEGNFLLKTLFLVKIGTYYRGCRRPFNSLQWKKLSNFFWSRELYSIE